MYPVVTLSLPFGALSGTRLLLVVFVLSALTYALGLL
jgi:hypothetical protein